MATESNTAKFNRRAIMMKAWSLYRDRNRAYAAWQRERFPEIAEKCSFSGCLQSAWFMAKRERAAAEREVAIAANAKAASIRSAIERLKYKSLRYDTGAMKRGLAAKLDRALEAA